MDDGRTGLVQLVPARERIHVVARGEIDIATAPQVLAAVDDVVRVGFRQVVIDLRDVTFMDVAGVRALLDANRTAKRAAARASIVASERVRRVLALTGALAPLDVQLAPARRRFVPRGHALSRP